MFLPRPQLQSARPPHSLLKQASYRANHPPQPPSQDSEESVEEYRRQKQKFVDPEFHLFSTLPKELRLEIWKFHLPPPRLLELNFFLNADRGYRPSKRPGQFDTLNWAWECTSPLPIHPPHHLLICKEYLAAVKYCYVFLNVFKRTQEGGVNAVTWGKVYCDYARDTIYFSKRNWELFADSCNGRFPSIKEMPVDLKRVRRLAVSSLLPHRWLRFQFYGVQQFRNPGGRELAKGVLEPIFSLLEGLDRFYITIDGRREKVGWRKSQDGGLEGLVDAGEEFFDYYEDDGQENYVEWISSVGEELRTKHPELKIPPFELGLLINEEPLQELERRWDYTHAKCRFSVPGFTGHRTQERAVIPGQMRFFHDDTSSSSEEEWTDNPEVEVEVVNEYDSDGNLEPVYPRPSMHINRGAWGVWVDSDSD